MPLFSNSQRTPTPPPQTVSPSQSRGGFFSRRAESPEYANGYPPANGSDSVRSGSTSGRSGFFSFRRRSSDSLGGLDDFKRDPSIVAARQKVTDAESAEAAADRALIEARAAVRGAKEQVKMLEQEIMEEARRARAKQAEAKTIRKSTGRLGRHG